MGQYDKHIRRVITRVFNESIDNELDIDREQAQILRSTANSLSEAQRAVVDTLLGASPEMIKEATVEILVGKVSTWYENPVLPEKGESAVVSIDCPKTAALLFDRVWGPISKESPDPVSFMACTRFEIEALTYISLLSFFKSIAESRSKAEARQAAQASKILYRLLINGQRYYPPGPYPFSRALCEEFRKELGIAVRPMYGAEGMRDLDYRPGQYEILIPCLTNLEVVSEDALSWEQVLNFRRDIEAQEKYRQLIHWVDKEMIGKSQAFIEDEMANRLEDYYWALKKHGIKTIVGLLSSLVAPPILTGIFAGSSPLAPLLAGISLTAGVVGSVVKASLNIEDTKRSYQEIAFVHEVMDKVKDKNE